MLIHASAAESGEQWNKRDLKAQAEAREAYELLCEAHGGHSSYSVSELEEMIVSGVDLPPEILTQKTVKYGMPCLACLLGNAVHSSRFE